MSEPGSGQSQNSGFGFTQPLKAMLAVVSTALHTRLDLLVVEVEEEVERSKQILALFLVVIYGISFGFVLLNIFLIALFWQNGWIAAIGLLALVYFAVAAIAAIKLRGSTVRAGGLFPTTLAELAKDRDRLKAAAREP